MLCLHLVLSDKLLETEMFGLVRDRGLGLMAYSPLAVGLLGGTYRSGQPAPAGTLWGTRFKDRFASTMQGATAQVVNTVQQIAAEQDATAAQIAIAWVLAQPEVSCVISGADTIEQLDDVLGAIDISLSSEVRQRLDDVSAAAHAEIS